jgi:hypothetical protein
LIDAASHNLQQHRRPRNAPAVGDLEREGLHEQELDLLLGQRAEAADLLEGEAAVGGRSLEDLSTPLKVDQRRRRRRRRHRLTISTRAMMRIF